MGNTATPVGIIDLVYGAAPGRETLPIETSRRGRRCRHPIQHDVVEQFVATQHVLGIAVAIGPGPELLEDPRRLPARRIGQAIAERLRPGRLLLGITGVPIPIILDPAQRPGLLMAGLSLDVGRTPMASVMWMPAQWSGSCAPSAVVTAEPQSPPCAP